MYPTLGTVAAQSNKRTVFTMHLNLQLKCIIGDLADLRVSFIAK